MSPISRQYTSRRLAIVTALAEKLKLINGEAPYITDLEERVSPRLLFWDEIQEFPAVHLNAGSESRQYQGAGYKDRFLNITIRCYVNDDNSASTLEGLIEDIETVIESNGRLAYLDRQGNTQYTQQISIVNIDTDEGVLEPLGVGEISCEVRY